MSSSKGWLGSLVDRINSEQLMTFLISAIPELDNDYQALQTYLQANDWPAAARQAYKCKSVVKLLGMNDLLDYLVAIENTNLPVIANAEFHRDLALCYYTYIHHMKSYLNEQTS